MATQDRLPTGNSAVSDTWVTGTAGNKWDDVDDPVGTPDDATTYILKNDANNAIQLFTFTAFAITSSAISHIRVFVRAQRTAAGACTIRRQLRVNGTTYLVSTNATATTSWADYTADQLTNPNTALAWVEADVEGTGAAPLQEIGLGISNWNAGEELQATQMYAQVDYTDAAGGGDGLTPGKLQPMGIW